MNEEQERAEQERRETQDVINGVGATATIRSYVDRTLREGTYARKSIEVI